MILQLHRNLLRVRCLTHHHGHAWQTRSYPPACSRCGATMRGDWGTFGDMPDWMR